MIYIPKKLKVGFQKRQDTYTKKLAYLIYYDEKNKLRKEASWKTWKDDSIPSEEVENVPISGFVLNKGVQRYHTERNYIRVFDPRGFEFEISISNLTYILTETSCDRNSLDGEFIYGYDGQILVLLPVESEEYRTSVKFSNLKAKTIKTKELVPAHTYRDKNLEEYTYLGFLPFTEVTRSLDTHTNYTTKERFTFSPKKTHLFLDNQKNIIKLNPSKLGEEVSTGIQDIESLLGIYRKSNHNVTPKCLRFLEVSNSDSIIEHGLLVNSKSREFIMVRGKNSKGNYEYFRNYSYSEEYYDMSLKDSVLEVSLIPNHLGGFSSGFSWKKPQAKIETNSHLEIVCIEWSDGKITAMPVLSYWQGIDKYRSLDITKRYNETARRESKETT